MRLDATLDTGLLSGKTIAVIDDHALFLEGLAGLLRSMALDVTVATFQTGLAFLEKLHGGLEPDLVLTDLTMKSMNGLAIVDAVHAQSRHTPVLIVSGIDASIIHQDIVASGACGLVPKACDVDELTAAVLAALSNGRAAVKAEPYEDPLLQSRVSDLSQRQLEVLTLLGTGASNKEISGQLNISDNTVKSHLKAIFVALGVSRRTASIQKARALGLI
jgi:DNA-binding NarL/FixJ family response regulator